MCKTLTRPRRNRKMNRWSERCGSFSVSSSWILRKKKKVLCYTCHQNPKTKNTMKNENIHDCLGLLIADAAALGCHWLGYRCVCASFCCSRKNPIQFHTYEKVPLKTLPKNKLMVLLLPLHASSARLYATYGPHLKKPRKQKQRKMGGYLRHFILLQNPKPKTKKKI